MMNIVDLHEHINMKQAKEGIHKLKQYLKSPKQRIYISSDYTIFCRKANSFDVDSVVKTSSIQTSSSIFIVFPECFFVPFRTFTVTSIPTVYEAHASNNCRVVAGISKTLINPLGQETLSKWMIKNQPLFWCPINILLCSWPCTNNELSC